MAAELAEPGNEDGEVHAQAKPKPDVEKVEDNPNSKEDLELVALDVVKEAPKKEEAERELAVVPHKEAASKGANRNSLVPLFVEERGHGKDGELLRDFILRRVHLKEDFRDAALKRWLIREDFFDEFFPEYVKQYGVPGSSHSEAESERLEQLAEECKDILVPSMHSRKKVTDLEAVATSTDVYQLRDTLLVAVKDLTTPRRFLGLASNSLMSDKAKETLALAEQRRLRKVVFQCLKGIWESGVGGEVLKMAMDAVRSRIERFKSKAGESSDVIQAMAGQEWAQLEDLVQTIDEQDQAGGHRGPLGPVEGRRTKVVIDRALDALGGQGTLREVIEWIEKNPKELEELREAKLNRNIRDGRRKPVWHSTVGSTIAAFRKVPRAGPPTRYLSSKAPEPEEPMAIQDAPAAKARSKRVAKKQLAEGGDDSAAQSAPKPKRIRKAKAQAAPAESSEAPTDTVPLRPGQAEDPSA
mmetsp:Transcript_20090/g.47248  ORF Transcript_20090/g.47248 Transcript_20090/m.47248 type:complete len:470 (-) Transcript_20090:141-1550(-)